MLPEEESIRQIVTPIRTKIGELLSSLPDSQREVIVMMKVMGMSVQEVAQSTGSSQAAVKQKAYRAYEKIRRLQGEGSEKRAVRSVAGEPLANTSYQSETSSPDGNSTVDG